MKKIVLTIGAVAGLAVSGFSQGQINFENGSADGYVVQSSASDTTAGTSGTYAAAGSFTATLWAIETPTSSDSGLNGLDAYGSLNLADLASDGFVQLSTAASQFNVAGSAGAFGGAGVTFNVPGVTASQTVFAVICWTGVETTLAAALTDPNDYIGSLVFVNSTAGAPPSGLTGADDIYNGWNALANSPRSSAEGGNQDLIMTLPVPEPTTLAFAGLGGLSLLLFRRRS